jgi:ASPIC and UnbV/FG-GAP-like repeat
VSQPLDQYATIDPLGKQREDLGEFFLANPWQRDDHNLSSYERNRLLLNVGDARFVNVSHLTGADLDSDSRSAVAADLDNDGMQDLVVRSVGGGPLRVFHNEWPAQHWLKVSLRGTRSNSLGLGASVRVVAGDLTVARTLYPVAAYQSQAPSQLYFGLADATAIDLVEIQWPSGEVQTLQDVPVDSHVVIHESGTWKRLGM